MFDKHWLGPGLNSAGKEIELLQEERNNSPKLGGRSVAGVESAMLVVRSGDLLC